VNAGILALAGTRMAKRGSCAFGTMLVQDDVIMEEIALEFHPLKRPLPAKRP